MIKNNEMLNFIRQNVEMGIDGIKTILKYTDDNQLRTVLNDQMNEYSNIYNRADHLLMLSGGETKNVNAFAKISANLSSNFKHMNGDTGKIAESMIKGSSMGITKIVQHRNDFSGDEKIDALAAQLQHTEENNIDQLKKFL